jgi:PAS domain S-box-containing protein
MGDHTPDPDPSRILQHLLREQAALVVERWERRLRADPRLPEARRAAAPVLREDGVALLARIADRLGRLADGRAGGLDDGDAVGAAPDWDGCSGEDLPAALGELSHLRAALLELCAAEGIRMEGEAAVLVHAALDGAMTTLAVAHAHRAVASGALERERLDLTLRLLPVGVFIADAGGRMLNINDAARRLWGPETPFAGSVAEYAVYRGYRPGSTEPIAAEDWTLSRALRGEAPVDEEVDMISSDGERRTILNSALALRDGEGNITGGVAVNVDITDRKRTELRLAAILEGALDAIVLIDASGRILEVNPAAERTFGYPRAEALGRELADLVIEPGLREAHRRGLRRYLATGQSKIVGRRVEMRAMRADGALIDTELSVIPLPTVGPRVLAGFVRDITDRRQAERERAREAEFRERFLGILGHDLRTPLSAVTFAAHSLLRQAAPGDAWTPGLTRIVRSADRMARMIRDLLDFTRARQGGGIPVTPAPGDLEAICRHVLEEIQLTHPGRAVAVRCSGGASGRWDPDRIAQVVQNLVVNAFDYSPPDTPVRVAVEGAGDRVTLAVTNEGPPIPPEVLVDLFNPFHGGAHAAEGRASEGLGLGLYIAHQIVIAHRGCIEVESDAERGTTFRVDLPRSLAQVEAA